MDPSQAPVNANQLEQIETITCMDCDSYNAAAEGKIEVFENIIDHESLGLLLTPNKNTILHIYITALNSGSNSTIPNAGSESTTALNAGTESTTPIGRSGSTTNFVEEILKMCPSVLCQANAKSETPLHIAARYGHDDIVEVLIKYCAQTLHEQDLEVAIEPIKEMLRMTNKEKDTALHEAVRYNHLEVVKLLISKDSDFSYSANDAGETPLYIAAERGFKHVLFEILDKCKSPMHWGPLGRTALHAAVKQNDKGMVIRILEKIEGISREVDNNGWTSLHLAAYFDSDDIAKQLLDKDREVAYMKDTKGRTPLHIAAQGGCVDAMKMIVERCPDCCEQVDNRDWNVLHFAIKDGKYRCLEKILEIIKENWSLSNLLNEKNADGNTPLHFHFCSIPFQSANNLVSHPRVDKMAFNKQNLTALDMASTVNHSREEMTKIWDASGRPPRRVITYEDETIKLEEEEERRSKGKEERRSMLHKATEVHLIVAALIATVTFAACITMPGGFVGGEGSHPGSALLRKSVAFNAFVITDTISMVLSSSAVFIHLLMPFLLNVEDESREKLLFLAFKFILGAMVAMGLAFITGTYAVLVPTIYLAIANCIIGLTFFAILIYVFGQFIGLSSFDIFNIIRMILFDIFMFTRKIFSYIIYRIAM